MEFEHVPTPGREADRNGWRRSAGPWAAAGAWAGFIAALLLVTGPETGAAGRWLRRLEALGADKVVHWGLFLVLAVLVVRALPAGVSWRRLTLAFLLMTGYGALTELLQLAVPARSAELADLGADAIGGLCGILVALLVRRRL
jgi:VanZ family protein